MGNVRYINSISGGGNSFFSSSAIQSDSATHPASYSMGLEGAVPPGIKGPANDADYWFLLVTNLKMNGALPVLPPPPMSSQLC